MGILYLLVVGLVAGWLAGIIMKSNSGSIWRDMLVGVVGAFLGNWLFGILGITLFAGILGSIVTALIGAIVLVALLRVFFK